jgi:branched-subunit amino acid ABC-type transport system permease component
VHETMQFAVLGLGLGAVYILLAQGVVAVYRGSGIINFAHGALAMVAGHLFTSLCGTHGWPTVPAGVAAVATAGALAAATQLFVLRRLTTASPLTRTVSTLGVFITLQSAALVVWGPDTVFTPAVLPQGRLTVSDVSIGVDRLWMLGIAVALTAAMWGIGRYTRFGLATAATAESEETVAAAGWSPNLLALSNFALGGMLAGLAGVLVAPIAGIQAGVTSLLVLPALAVALLGGFSSFVGTAVAGLALGIAESVMGNHVTTQGATKSLPFAVIVVVLMVRGQALPLRAYIFDRLPRLGSGVLRPRVALLLFAATTALVLFAFPIQWVEASTVGFAWMSVLLSIVVLTGYCGQLSLGQFALAGIAAWSAGRLVDGQGWPFGLALVAGVIVAGVVGLVFAVPALRTRGANLGVVTMGLGLSLYLMVFTNPRFTGGSRGTRVEPISLFGIDVDPLLHPERYAVMALGFSTVCCFVVARLRHTDAGRAMIATRSNERAAAALGFSVLQTKMLAFALSAVVAGVGGVLLAFRSRTIGLGAFDPFSSVLAVAYAVIGGVGATAGAVIGALLVPTGILNIVST